MDSLQVVGFAQHAVNSFLPGLDPVAAALLVGVLVSALLYLFQFLSRAFTTASGVSAGWWTKHRDAINPILAILLGLLGAGSPIGAFLGLAGHGILKGVTKAAGHAASVSTGAINKGKAVALALMLSGLAFGAVGQATASPVRSVGGFTVDAGVPVDRTPFLERLSWGFGPGVRFEARPGANVSVGYVVGTVGYVFNGHLNLKVRGWRDAEQAPKGGGAVEALWVW